jgi:TolA-binding protein
MKRLLILGLIVGPVMLMGQKKDDIIAIQRDLANLEDKVSQLQKLQDDKFTALQSMLQQAVDNSNKVAAGLATLQKEIDSKLNDQQTKLVAPVATLGTKVDQMADDFRSVSVNVADLLHRMDAVNTKLDDISNAIRTIGNPPQAPGAPTGATGGTGLQPSPQVPAESAETMWDNAFRDYQTGKQDLAMQEFNNIVKTYPGTDAAANAQYYIGYMYYTANQYEDAVKAFDVLLSFNENSRTQDGLYYKAVSLQKAEHRTLAAAAYREFLSKYPTNEHAAQARKNLHALGMSTPGSAKRRP